MGSQSIPLITKSYSQDSCKKYLCGCFVFLFLLGGTRNPFNSPHLLPIRRLSNKHAENSHINPLFLQFSLLLLLLLLFFLLLLLLLLLPFLLLLLHLSLTQSSLPHSLSALRQLLLHFLPHRVEVRVRHRLLRRQSVLPLSAAPLAHRMIVDQRLVQIVVQLFADKPPRRLVLELPPGSLLVAAQQLQGLAVEAEMVASDVPVQILAAHHLSDAPQLIVVVFPAEKGGPIEDDAQQHAGQRPDVQRVVVFLAVQRGKRGNCVVGEKLGAFVMTRADSDVVSLVCG